MLSPDCSQLLLGLPLISAEALGEFHDLLTSLPIHADRDRASQNSPSKEGIADTIGISVYPQMNLPLLNVPAGATVDDQPNELTIALMELLISAADEENEQEGKGGEDESEPHA